MLIFKITKFPVHILGRLILLVIQLVFSYDFDGGYLEFCT